MPWINGDIVVYHGTDNLSGSAIRLSGLDPNRFNPKTDFGKGFYVTTSLHQAQQWANQRCRSTTHLNPEVLEYHLLRDVIENLSRLTFVIDTTDYHEFVEYCRPGQTNHGPLPRATPYDVVYGPKSSSIVKIGARRTFWSIDISRSTSTHWSELW